MVIKNKFSPGQLAKIKMPGIIGTIQDVRVGMTGQISHKVEWWNERVLTDAIFYEFELSLLTKTERDKLK